jgi:hypothetical protein
MAAACSALVLGLPMAGLPATSLLAAFVVDPQHQGVAQGFKKKKTQKKNKKKK